MCQLNIGSVLGHNNWSSHRQNEDSWSKHVQTTGELILINIFTFSFIISTYGIFEIQNPLAYRSVNNHLYNLNFTLEFRSQSKSIGFKSRYRQKKYIHIKYYINIIKIIKILFKSILPQFQLLGPLSKTLLFVFPFFLIGFIFFLPNVTFGMCEHHAFF